LCNVTMLDSAASRQCTPQQLEVKRPSIDKPLRT
jgi:hypothetical protein